jgi:hypothetical protein
MKVYECTQGEHKGQQFVYYSSVIGSKCCYQQVVNNKINRYPYFTFENYEMQYTGIEIGYEYNRQIEIKEDDIKADKVNAYFKEKDCITQQQIDSALVIAYRIINHEEGLEQVEIYTTKEYDFGNSREYLEIKIKDTSNKLFSQTVATIVIVDGEYFIIHEKLHHDEPYRIGRTTLKRISENMRNKFDNKRFGFRYKKPIDISELELLYRELY